MKKTILLSVLISIFSFALNAQTIKGKIIDPLSGKGIPHVKISEDYEESDYSCFSNENGEFTLNLEYFDYIYLYIQHYDYTTKDTSFEFEKDIDNLIIYLGDDDYSSTMYTQVGFSFDFFIPEMTDKNSSYQSYFGTDMYAFNFNFFHESPIQLGLKITPFKMEWMNFRDNTSLTTNAHIKERYFSLSSSFDLYTRFRFSEFEDETGMFLDIGIGYKLPYLLRYTYFTDKNTKTCYKGIHRFNNVRVMARLGFLAFAIKAEYMLFNTLQTPYFQEPRLSLGIDFLVPTY